MNLTQGLPLEIRDKLEKRAARRGTDPDRLLLALVEQFLLEEETFPSGAVGGVIEEPDVRKPASTLPPPRSPASDAERFRLWADSHGRTTPVLPLESMDREHFYQERG